MSEQQQGFSSLGVSPAIARALDEMGFEEPTPIQGAAIAHLLAGKDLIGKAQTGTGKTAAYAVPLLQRIQVDAQRPQALILAPTRELALQVADEIAKIGKYLGVRELAVCGGHPIERQIRALRAGVSVVVGTPGRVMDLIERRVLRLDEIGVFVLDEADEMLDMGFVDDIESIIDQLPATRQNVCFCATMPEAILQITRRHMRSPVTVSIDREEQAPPAIEQAYFEVRDRDKIDTLTRIVDHDAISRGLVFCRTKRGCDEVSAALQARGYLAEPIHGDLNQAQRNRALSRFKEGQVDLLVATDVAARGIDIEGLTHVINYDIAASPDSHVHRIGRTGRAGREGTAFTLIHPREVRQLRLIERATGTRIPRRRVPTAADVAERAIDQLREKIGSMVAAGAGQEPRFLDLAQGLMEEHDPEKLIAALVAAIADTRTSSTALSDAAANIRPTSGPDFPDTGAERGYVRLFINIGARQRVTPADFVRTIAREADISGSLIGAIDIHDEFTFVEVPKEVGHVVLEAMEHASIQGRGVRAEPARPMAR